VKTSQVALKAALEKLALEVVEAALALEEEAVVVLLPRQEVLSAP
jgi:hypothetical protein